MTANPARTGRASSFPPEIANTICERIAGGESLRAVCRDDAMPSRATVNRWLAAHADFRGQYARACEMRAERIADELLEIADDSRKDWVKRDDGTWLFDSEHLTRTKLRLDARKWMLSKLAPRRYGHRIVDASNAVCMVHHVGSAAATDKILTPPSP